ncbi:hypothetical protein ACCO45_000246 [Purpureocillium lilacinum]|uniref:Uncharacterized protein n=1 Tax=Purpureocillium lilacinum TaxID=33203 RepID=A0ACC4E500_PURLI
MQHDSFTPHAHKHSPIFSIRTSNMADKEPIRVVICGKSEEVGRGIIAGLQPEVEVIHFGLSPAALAAELPAVLAGRAPASASSGLGTGNYQEEEGEAEAAAGGGVWGG